MIRYVHADQQWYLEWIQNPGCNIKIIRKDTGELMNNVFCVNLDKGHIYVYKKDEKGFMIQNGHLVSEIVEGDYEIVVAGNVPLPDAAYKRTFNGK